LKTRVFYRPFSGRDKWCVSRAQSKPERVPHGAWIRAWKHLTRSLRFESSVSTTIKSRASMKIESCVSTAIESRVYTTIESHVSTPLKFASPLDQHDDRVYVSCVLSHTKRYLCFCNQFNSTLVKVTDNSTGSVVHRQINHNS